MLLDLPEELLFIVFCDLPFNEFIKLTQTCKQLYKFNNDHSIQYICYKIHPFLRPLRNETWKDAAKRYFICFSEAPQKYPYKPQRHQLEINKNSDSRIFTAHVNQLPNISPLPTAAGDHDAMTSDSSNFFYMPTNCRADGHGDQQKLDGNMIASMSSFEYLLLNFNHGTYFIGNKYSWMDQPITTTNSLNYGNIEYHISNSYASLTDGLNIINNAGNSQSHGIKNRTINKIISKFSKSKSVLWEKSINFLTDSLYFYKWELNEEYIFLLCFTDVISNSSMSQGNFILKDFHLFVLSRKTGEEIGRLTCFMKSGMRTSLCISSTHIFLSNGMDIMYLSFEELFKSLEHENSNMSAIGQFTQLTPPENDSHHTAGYTSCIITPSKWHILLSSPLTPWDLNISSNERYLICQAGLSEYAGRIRHKRGQVWISSYFIFDFSTHSLHQLDMYRGVENWNNKCRWVMDDELNIYMFEDTYLRTLFLNAIPKSHPLISGNNNKEVSFGSPIDYNYINESYILPNAILSPTIGWKLNSECC